jgi:NAD(P)-dependent dehydrogenase (short-subunit alcohol dehydrogenase family)
VVDAALVERVMNTNFLGPVNCLEALQPQLVAGNRVVLVSSMAHWLPFPRAEAYGASKAALSWFADSLRLDWEPKGLPSRCLSGLCRYALTRKNDFAMPGRVSVDEAVKAIRSGWRRENAHRVSHRFGFILRLLSGLPAFFSARCCAGWCVHEHCDYRQRHCRADLRLATGRAPSGDPV